MNIKNTIETATKKLQSVTDRPRLEAEILLAHHLGCERVYLMTHDSDEVEDIDAFWAFVGRRAKYEPIEYITNRVSFYDSEFYIAVGALIPRPETELLIDEAAKIISSNRLTHIAEIGIGSGVISIILARKFDNLQIEASDISTDALKIAKQNITKFKLQDRIKLHHTSLLDSIDTDIEMIVSNPPYIAKGVKLEPNVVDYEPHTALFGKERGDEILRDIITLSKKRGIKYLVCEMGYDQREYISEFVKEIGVYSIRFYKDLSGLDRGFVIRMY